MKGFIKAVENGSEIIVAYIVLMKILVSISPSNGLASNDTVVFAAEEIREDPGLSLTLGGIAVDICPYHTSCKTLGCGFSSDKDCNCDSECASFGDCCWDYATVCSKETQRRSSSVTAFAGLWTCESVPYGDIWRPRHYFFVGKCPREWKYEMIRDLCERDARTNDSIAMILKINNLDDVSFKNVFCALCNGVIPEAMVSWNLSANCPAGYNRTISTSPFSPWDDLTSCSRVSMASPHGMALPRLCSPFHGISSCPSSSASDSLTDACSLYKANVVIEYLSYKNPHCYYCHHNNSDAFSGASTKNDSAVMQETYCTIEDNLKSQDSIQIYVSRGFFIVPITVFFQLPTLQEIVREHLGDTDDEVDQMGCDETPHDTYSQNEDRIDIGFSDPSSLVIECPSQTFPVLSITATLHMLSPEDPTLERDEKALSIIAFVADFFRVPVISLNLESLTSRSCNNEDTLKQTVPCFYIYDLKIVVTDVTYIRKVEENVESQSSSTSSVDIYVIKRLELVRECQDNDTVSGLQCPQELISVTSETVIIRNHTGFVCSDDCRTLELVGYFKTIMYPFNSSEISALVFDKEACIIGQCEILFDNEADIMIASVMEAPLAYNNHALTEAFGFPWNKSHSVYCVSSSETIHSFLLGHEILTFIGCMASIIALILTLITYGMFASLRKSTFVKLIMAYAILLIHGQIELLLLGVATYVPMACLVISVVAHFTWLCAFTITTCIAAELHRTFGRMRRESVKNDKIRTLVTYLCVAFTFPLFVVIPCLVLHWTGSTVLTYGDPDRGCWIGDPMANLFAFVAPLACVLVINVFLFIATLNGLCCKRDVYKGDRRKKRREAKRNVGIAIKISSLLGFTWIFGFAASFSDLEPLWYTFIVLNTMQGVFIFACFMCNRAVCKLWKRALSRVATRRVH